MKKTSLLLKASVFFIILTFVLIGCSKPDENIKAGIYVADDGIINIRIEEDKTFTLQRNIATIYDPVGTYKIKDNILTLHLDDELDEHVVIFKVSGDTLIFESGRLAENLIEVGTEFVYRNEDSNDESDNKLDDEVKVGIYVANEGFSHLILEKEKTFLLHRDAISGYSPIGNYSKDGDILILYFDNEPKEYATKFKISGDTLIFESGINEESFIKQGTKFVFRDKNLSFGELEKEYLESGGRNRFMEGVEFGIGDKAEELIEKRGDPISSGDFNGGVYLEYEDEVFFTDGYFRDGETYIYGKIVSIGTTERYGVYRGMTIEQSREVLGDPDARGIFDELIESGYGIVDPEDFYYKGDYTLCVPYDGNTKLVNNISLDRYRREPDIIGSGFLVLTDWELSKYEEYIINFDDNEIYDCTPINIMKMYIHALKEKNYEAQWELYTKEENQFGWDKEYHVNIPEKDRVTDLSPYINVENIEVNYSDDYKHVTVSWEDKDLGEYDGRGKPFRHSFNLVGESDQFGNRKWKVLFMPMQ